MENKEWKVKYKNWPWNREKDNIKTKTKSISIIGENGSGKSTLLDNIRENNKNIEFVYAQRVMLFKQGYGRGKSIEELKSLRGNLISQTGEHFYLNNEKETSNKDVAFNDFSSVLQLLIRGRRSFNEKNRGKKLDLEKDILEKVIKIWNKVFSNLEMYFSVDNDEERFKIKNKKTSEEYDSEDLSDGEKAAFYIIAKVLLSEKEIFMIDEPESFLNTAVLVNLFDELEKERPDLHFVYFSHDLNFINSREDNTLFWIKDFTYPDIFQIEKVEKSEKLPSDLIIKLIGSKKKKILFIEGTGYDEKLYKILYPDFQIQSVGSCENIINFTKALNENGNENYNKEYYGLIDKDFRSDGEIESLKLKNIFTIPFAIFENLFFAENIIRFYFKDKGEDKNNIDKVVEEVEERVKGKIKDDKFKNAYKKYHFKQSFKQNLNNFDFTKNIEYKFPVGKLDKELGELESKSYKEILKKYNQKNLNGALKTILKVPDSENWIDNILKKFNTDKREVLKDEFFEIDNFPEIK